MVKNSQGHRIPRPLLPHCQSPQLKRLTQDRSRRRRDHVLVTAEVQDGRAEAEHERGQQIRKPESDIALRVDHGDRSNQCSNVVHGIEIVENTRDSLLWVDDDTLTSLWKDLDVRVSLPVLFSDEGRDV